MNKQELEQLNKAENKPNVLSAADVKDQTDRTLLWGYTCDRHLFHVYLHKAVLHCLIYDYDQRVISHLSGEINIYDLTPDKRVHSESTDFLFAKTLRSLGAQFSLCAFDENVEKKIFYGLMSQELQPTPEDQLRCRNLSNDLQGLIQKHHQEELGLTNLESYNHELAMPQANTVRFLFLAYINKNEITDSLLANISRTRQYFIDHNNQEITDKLNVFLYELNDMKPPVVV